MDVVLVKYVIVFVQLVKVSHQIVHVKVVISGTLQQLIVISVIQIV